MFANIKKTTILKLSFLKKDPGLFSLVEFLDSFHCLNTNLIFYFQFISSEENRSPNQREFRRLRCPTPPDPKVVLIRPLNSEAVF